MELKKTDNNFMREQISKESHIINKRRKKQIQKDSSALLKINSTTSNSFGTVARFF